MKGMNARTGAPIDGDAHLAQSVTDILTTPVGSRVMRRAYGSRLFDLVDAATNPALRVKLTAAVAGALLRWEPRIRLSRVNVRPGPRQGAVVLDLEGVRTDRPGPLARLSLSVPLNLNPEPAAAGLA